MSRPFPPTIVIKFIFVYKLYTTNVLIYDINVYNKQKSCVKTKIFMYNVLTNPHIKHHHHLSTKIHT